MNLGFHCHHCGIGHFAAPTRLSQGVRWEKRDKASGKKLRKQTACFESSVTMRAEIGAFGQFGHIHFHRGRCLCNVGIDMHWRTLHVLDCFRVSFCSHILRQHTAVSLLFHGFPGDLGGMGGRGVLFTKLQSPESPGYSRYGVSSWKKCCRSSWRSASCLWLRTGRKVLAGCLQVARQCAVPCSRLFISFSVFWVGLIVFRRMPRKRHPILAHTGAHKPHGSTCLESWNVGDGLQHVDCQASHHEAWNPSWFKQTHCL